MVRTPTGATVHRSDSVASGGDMLLAPALRHASGRELSLDYGVGYDVTPAWQNWGITLEWQRELAVEDRTRGDRLFLQMAASLL